MMVETPLTSSGTLNIMVMAANRFGDIKGEVSSDKKYMTILFNASDKPVQPCYNIASAHATMHN